MPRRRVAVGPPGRVSMSNGHASETNAAPSVTLRCASRTSGRVSGWKRTVSGSTKECQAVQGAWSARRTRSSVIRMALSERPIEPSARRIDRVYFLKWVTPVVPTPYVRPLTDTFRSVDRPFALRAGPGAAVGARSRGVAARARWPAFTLSSAVCVFACADRSTTVARKAFATRHACMSSS